MFRKYGLPAIVVLFALYAAAWFGVAKHLELNTKLELDKINKLSVVEQFEYKKVHITGFPLNWKLAIEKPNLKLNFANLKDNPKIHPAILHGLNEAGLQQLKMSLSKPGKLVVSGNIFQPQIKIKNKGQTIIHLDGDGYHSGPIVLESKKEIIKVAFEKNANKESIYDYAPLINALQSFDIHAIKNIEITSKESTAYLGEQQQTLLGQTELSKFTLVAEHDEKQRHYHLTTQENHGAYTQALIEFAQAFNRQFIKNGRYVTNSNNIFKLVALSPQDSRLDATLSLPKNLKSKGLLDFPNPIHLDLHEYRVDNKLGKTKVIGDLHIKRENGFTIKIDGAFKQHQAFNKNAPEVIKSIVLNQFNHNAADKPFHGPQFMAYADEVMSENWVFPKKLDARIKFNGKFDLLAGEMAVELNEYTLGNQQASLKLSGNTELNGPKLSGQARITFVNHPQSLKTLLQWVEHINKSHQQSNCLCLQFSQFPFIELPKNFYEDAKQAVYTLATNKPDERDLHVDVNFNARFDQAGSLNVSIKDKSVENWLPKLSLMRGLKKKNCLQVWDKLAKANHPNAHFNLGRYHLNFRKDYATALKHFEAADKAGHSYAALKLAIMYQGGFGVTKDTAKSAKYIIRAAEGGCAPAQNELGVLYERGTGVKRDMAKARHWYQKAANQHLRSAQFNLWQLERPLKDKAFIVANGVAGERVVCHEYNKQSIEQMAKALKLLGWKQANFLPEGQPDAIPGELRLYAFETFNKNGIEVPGFEPPKTDKG